MMAGRFGAVFIGAAGIALALAGAAGAAPREMQAKEQPRSETAAASAEADAPQAEDWGCTRARRRLWVEGEGWIVRRVTTCP